jgi:pilus assembly protein CpaC
MNRPALLLAAFLCSAAALGTAPSFAASAAPQLVPVAGTSIDIEVGKGRLIRLERPASSVFIADPEVADVEVKSPTLVYVFGKASGKTTLFAVGDHDEVLLNTNLMVRYDVTRVTQAIHELAPHSAVSVSTADDAVVISGTVYSAAEGDDIRRIAAHFIPDEKQLLDKMKVDAPNQINLRVRFAEVSRDVIKQFGIDWQNMFSAKNIMFGLVTATGGGALTAAGSGVFPLSNFVTSSGTPIGFNTGATSLLGGATNNNIYAGGKIGNATLDTIIDALDNHGLVTILAEPNLSAISGEPAKFLAGGEFPVPVPAGNGTVGIDWKSFGVSLNFVGTIVANDRISLHVAPEVSQLSTQGELILSGTTVPSLTTRKAETTIELGSGQSFAIAGLLQNNITQQINKFPWLGDIPVLGQLFRSQAYQKNESELVILVTPYIVHPIATASRALTPSDAFVPATDEQSILHAPEFQPVAAQHAAGPVNSSGSTLVGPVGFSLE